MVTAPPLTNREYLLLADRIMDRLNHTWVRHKQAYSAGTLEVGTIYNAAILTVHATAAEQGHKGRSRNDARARALVQQLIEPPAFFTGPRGHRGKMYHSPGWLADLDRANASQDKSIDPKVVLPMHYWGKYQLDRFMGLMAPLEADFVWPDKRSIEVVKEELPEKITVIAVAGEGGG